VVLGGIPVRTVLSVSRVVNGFLGLITANDQIIVVGHRGWPSRYPDNTLTGFIAAATVADMIELDVRRSGDGKLVLSHDPILGGHIVAETPWSTLCLLDLGDFHHPALLDEAMAALPGTPVQMEIKNLPKDPGFEPDHRLALEAAERARPGDLVTSFNPDTVATVRGVFPDVPTGLVIPAGVALDEAVKHCLDVGHSALVPHHSLITDRLNEDVDVYTWTVNDPGRARELADFGVTGIISDDPGSITGTLGSR
jgi:glycerophosphoryl diester phosphodiesterase